MRRSCLIIVLIVLALTLLIRARRAADPIGKVIGVSDGDAITVLLKDSQGPHPVKVRLFGIDCPEMHQAYGSRAKQFTSQFAFGREARVVVRDTDRYGRTVGEVFIDNQSLNGALVDAGLAWAYVQYSSQFVDQEKAARAAKRGLWADKDPVPPWEFRRGERSG